MDNRNRWPEHICMSVAWQSTDTWVEQSGICRHLGPPKALRDQLHMPWPDWPLYIGRAAFDGWVGFLRRSDYNAIRAGLPFDGEQQAIAAFRVPIDGQLLDFFGLGESRVVPDPRGGDELVPQLVAGPSVAVLRGDRLGDQKAPAVSVLRLARHWWDRTLRGQRIRGRQPGDGAAYTDDEFLRMELDNAIRAAHQSTGRDRVDARAVYRRLNIGKSEFYERVRELTGKRWPELAAAYAQEFMEFRRNPGAAR